MQRCHSVDHLQCQVAQQKQPHPHLQLASCMYPSSFSLAAEYQPAGATGRISSVVILMPVKLISKYAHD